MLNELDDIKMIRTELKDGIAVISVEFTYDTDAEEKFDEVVQQVESVRNTLPSEIVYLDVMQWSSGDIAMIQLAFVSELLPYSEMENQADRLEKELERISGVKKVEIFALPEQEIRISLDMELMAEMNISISQVEMAIRSNNANIPGGSIKLEGKNFGIKTSGAYNNLDEIRNTVVQSYMGKLIHLKQIASINYGYEDLNYYARFNRERCIFLTIHQKEEVNVIDLVKEVKPEIERFRQTLPVEMELEYVFDQSEVIQTRMQGFTRNLLQGVFLVGVIILLFLGIRSAIIVILAIPLSIIIGLSFVDMAGFGLQQITIAAYHYCSIGCRSWFAGR